MDLRPIEILLVEDSDGDVRLTREVLSEIKTANHLSVATNGVEALAFLRREGPHADAPRPDIVLMDLNLPQLSGHGVLAAMRADEVLNLIPVVILTASEAFEDIVKSYDLHANCYVTKPFVIEEYETVMKSIEDFWFRVVKLPTRLPC